MFPIRDHNPSERTPYVTYALIALNVVIFASYWPLFNDEPVLGAFFQTWGMQPFEVSSGAKTHTLLTSMFLHGGLMHLAGNMLFLWIFGDNLEDQMGHVGFALFYLTAGIGADVGQLLADPSSQVPVVGASGAIAGVMGGYLLLFPRARVDIILIFVIFFKIFPVPAWVMLGVWFALQLFNGVVNLGGNGVGVAYWAHAGGFLIGLLLCLPLWLKRGGAAYWQATEGHPPHPEAKYKSTLPLVTRRK
ncbi:Membrane associated serine protease, rhomboid family [Litoreibacter ascidiaceicola]|uniref:Membrane associated serine protease, rhomboid family n=1 Tax=Litoreibacter ascidiaceicola TaxID=1486859 RepID=A0A1M4YBH9_9RHOB|nr:rhomboid family intramembrane serine protease [Litoreibacter ascidiaceicola]SHF02958.1 Membrane associated serine protease, rhomboid family [Litoreibacter ascidiaceicola]